MTVGNGLGIGAREPVDIKAEMRRAVDTLHSHTHKKDSMTSDLSIDEELNLHSIGWEPVELVCGVSLYSVPMGVWNWGQGEISWASAAYAHAFEGAIARIHRECAKAGGHGVVGVRVERSIHRHHIDVSLLGTAVRPVGAKRVEADQVFVSDLSARDFTLLHVSGWQPLGLAVGASFVYAPRRSLGMAMQQKSQNVELTNFTEAMYSARESAMERMQSSALGMAGTGVVEVKVTEGPMDFARHAVGFAAWGTVVRLAGDSHRTLRPSMVVPLDDPQAAFEATALRGR
ncbi:MAG TPA: hypothetical protein VG412_03215 [Acidimicrobiales bacterium]|nr:hypothetical protein [Acidimicrobiales bacterium]